MELNEVGVVAAFVVLPPEAREPRCGVELGARDLGERVQVQVINYAGDPIQDELDRLLVFLFFCFFVEQMSLFA